MRKLEPKMMKLHVEYMFILENKDRSLNENHP